MPMNCIKNVSISVMSDNGLPSRIEKTESPPYCNICETGFVYFS